MNKRDLAKVIEEARRWTNEQYELNKGQLETENYHIQKKLARLTLLKEIADTYLQERENGQL